MVSDLESGFKVAQATGRFIKIWDSVKILKTDFFFQNFQELNNQTHTYSNEERGRRSKEGEEGQRERENKMLRVI